MDQPKKIVRLGPANLEEGELRGYRIGKNQNVCVARIGGQYKAIDDWCNHAGCLLSGGHLEQNLVVCPCHEVGFDMDTGRNMTSPGVCDDQLPLELDVKEGELVIDAAPLAKYG